MGASITISFDKLCDKDHELAIREILACLVSLMENGRKKLSDLLEREMKGDEKTSFVFSEIINKKINENFQSNISKEKGNSTWPIVLTFILFLTIWPLGSLLADGLAFGTGFIFWLTLKFKLVKIVKVMVEAQRIE